MKDILFEEHEGVMAFEYIIMTILMSVASYSGFTGLSDVYKQKAQEMATSISIGHGFKNADDYNNYLMEQNTINNGGEYLSN